MLATGSQQLDQDNYDPAMQSFVNTPTFERGLGISPDIKAPMTAAAILAKEDPALNAAYALIEDMSAFDTAALK